MKSSLQISEEGKNKLNKVIGKLMSTGLVGKLSFEKTIKYLIKYIEYFEKNNEISLYDEDIIPIIMKEVNKKWEE